MSVPPARGPGPPDLSALERYAVQARPLRGRGPDWTILYVDPARAPSPGDVVLATDPAGAYSLFAVYRRDVTGREWLELEGARLSANPEHVSIVGPVVRMEAEPT